MIQHNSKILLGIVLICSQWIPVSSQGQLLPGVINRLFLELLVEKYGTNGVVTDAELQAFFPESKSESFTPEISRNCSRMPASEAKICFKEKCLSAADIFSVHNAPVGGASQSEILGMSGAIMYQVHNPKCNDEVETPTRDRSDPEVWLYGLLCVTAISLCSLGGVLFVSVMNTRIWKRFMMFMVALAVGTLAGSGILVLIPEAFALHEEESPIHNEYLEIATVIFAGIYLFFVSEKLLKIITKTKREDDPHKGISNRPVELLGIHTKQEKYGVQNGVVNPAFDSNGDVFEKSPTGEKNQDEEKLIDRLRKIKSVAWMVVFGDALHNFIDGLALGAAFLDSTLTGVSLAVAIFCEELPHELGDFAILLNSGMSMRMAVFCNFFSACTCYLGLIVGINIGVVGGQWIFAIAGGMFLYISLADMLPEMNLAADEEEEESGKMWPAFFIQNIGIIMGFCIILIMSLYGGDINFE